MTYDMFFSCHADEVLGFVFAPIVFTAGFFDRNYHRDDSGTSI